MSDPAIRRSRRRVDAPSVADGHGSDEQRRSSIPERSDSSNSPWRPGMSARTDRQRGSRVHGSHGVHGTVRGVGRNPTFVPDGYPGSTRPRAARLRWRPGRSGGMADAADLNSAARKGVRVRISAPAPRSDVVVPPRPVAALGLGSREPDHPHEAKDHPRDPRPRPEPCEERRPHAPSREPRSRDKQECGDQRCRDRNKELGSDEEACPCEAPLPSFQLAHGRTVRPPSSRPLRRPGSEGGQRRHGLPLIRRPLVVDPHPPVLEVFVSHDLDRIDPGPVEQDRPRPMQPSLTVRPVLEAR